MNAVQVSHLAKAFGSTQAVEDVNFDVQNGEIFGLLGPNGAGKTTTIRMVLDIFKPDRGEIFVLGGAMDEAKKRRIGYLPEERGLYQDVGLEQCLLYLASLKGLSTHLARSRLAGYLERFELAAHKGKKVKDLSKGMQQKAQIIATILHRPELIIIDEPFTALDPLNVQLVKNLILELRQQGAAIIMSTHQMHLVEELCDRILLINQGKDMLNGRLADIQREFSGQAVVVHALGTLPELPGVRAMTPYDHAMKLELDEHTRPQELLKSLVDQDVAIDRFEVALPSLDEIFIQVVQGSRSQ